MEESNKNMDESSKIAEDIMNMKVEYFPNKPLDEQIRAIVTPDKVLPGDLKRFAMVAWANVVMLLNLKKAYESLLLKNGNKQG